MNKAIIIIATIAMVLSLTACDDQIAKETAAQMGTDKSNNETTSELKTTDFEEEIKNNFQIFQTFSSNDVKISNIIVYQTNNQILVQYKIENGSQEFKTVNGHFSLYNKGNELICYIPIILTMSAPLSGISIPSSKTATGKIKEGFDDIIVERIDVNFNASY